MVIVLNIVLPYGLKLTFHLEKEIGTKIWEGMHQYDVASVEKNMTFSYFPSF